MKHIDVKSLLIGALLASTIIFGVGQTLPKPKWDTKQKWYVEAWTSDGKLVHWGSRIPAQAKEGMEPIGSYLGDKYGPYIVYRKPM